MRESKITVIYIIIAIAFVAIAFVTAPDEIASKAFDDQGEEFFPEFKDVDECTNINIITVNDKTGVLNNLEVSFENGLWVIPSHFGYPADSENQLGETATAFLDLVKGRNCSDNASEHSKFGVVDPENDDILEGKGKKVVLKNSKGQVLAELIIGDKVEGSVKQRYVRLPQHKRVYIAQINLEPSSSFKDWVETDLLKLNKNDITSVSFSNYSVVEAGFNKTLENVDKKYEISRKDSNSDWQLTGKDVEVLNKTMELDIEKVNTMLDTLDTLKLVDVERKPENLIALIKGETRNQTQNDAVSLQIKGFFGKQGGGILGNEGEMTISTNKGIVYKLYFGEIKANTDETKEGEEDKNDVGEDRYVIVFAQFNNSLLSRPVKPDGVEEIPEAELKKEKPDDSASQEYKDYWQAMKSWQENLYANVKEQKNLAIRFADWYYVISEKDFKKIKYKLQDILTNKSNQNQENKKDQAKDVPTSPVGSGN